MRDRLSILPSPDKGNSIMANVSDYVVVQDGTTTLEIGANPNETLSFAIPANVDLGQKAVVTWRFEAEGSPNNLAWNMNLNGRTTNVVNLTHSQDRFAALQEVVSGSDLNVGNNDLTVTVTGGTGRIKISDIVVHYRATV
jgi:hypothetical protein